MQREGLFREMKLRGHYEKPSERRAREKAEAIRRARKLARKKLQREGLLPMKPRVVPGTVGRGGPARGRLSDPGNSPTRSRDYRRPGTQPGLSSTAPIHGKRTQSDVAER
jgi:small subunit ribosomal protein S21